MNESRDSLEELDELLSALCDGRIRDDEFRRLEGLVCGDAELRRHYIRYMHMQGSLSRYVRVDLNEILPFDCGDLAARRRAGAAAAVQSEMHASPNAPAGGVIPAQRRWSVKRITRYAVAAVFLLACLIVADGILRNSVSAQAFDVALRQLSTAHVIAYIAEFKRDGKIVRSSESMHLQPDRVREELPDGKIKIIDFSKRKNITLDPVHRTAIVVTDTSPPQNYKPERFLDKVKESIERIRTDPLRTDRYLGQRSMNGREVEGFEMRKPTQVQTLWVDMETGLPAEMEIVALDDPGLSVVMRDFQFDVESYESLFSVDPPPGFDVTFETVGPAQPLDEKAKMIPR